MHVELQYPVLQPRIKKNLSYIIEGIRLFGLGNWFIFL